MTSKTSKARKRLANRARKGFRGYPIGTLAFYGPDDRRATKLVASIVEGEDEEPSMMEKWFSEEEDVRNDIGVIEQAAAFLERHGARSVVMPDRIIGCPHEEGIDYEGPTCPECPFWAIRDRWSGEVIQ